MNRRLSNTLNRVRSKAAPPPKLSISQWCDKFLYLPSESASEAGKFYCARFPWEREVLDAPQDPTVAEMVLRWAKQLGKSQVLQGIAAYYAHWEPSPLLYKLPSKTAAEQNSKERLEPLIQATPVLRALMGEKIGRDTGQTILLKKYSGGFWALVGANSTTDLKRRPARVVLQDEIDDDSQDVGGQGDPVTMANDRADTFSNAVKVMASTPSIVGLSRIDALYEATDQRQWICPCPKCGVHQALHREVHLKWNPNDHREAWIECLNPECRAQWDDGQRIAAIYAGHWEATRPFDGNRGYALSGMNRLIGLKKNHVSYLHEFVAQWLEAERSDETRKVHRINFDGLSYEVKTERVEADILTSRATAYTPENMPDTVLMLAAGLDVQPDRLEVEVSGIGLGEQTWGISYAVFPGDPLQADVWDRMDAFVFDTVRTCADGRKLKVACIGIDTGHATDAAYNYVRRRSGAYALKGKGGFGLPLVSLPRKSSVSKVKLYLVGSDSMKLLIYSRLNLKEAGPGYCHFPTGNGFDEHYFAGLTAEECVTHWQAGREVKTFVNPKRKRNEPLDCRQYLMAALKIYRPHLHSLSRSVQARATEQKKTDAPTTPPTLELTPKPPDKPVNPLLNRPGIRVRPRRAW